MRTTLTRLVCALLGAVSVSVFAAPASTLTLETAAAGLEYLPWRTNAARPPSLAWRW